MNTEKQNKNFETTDLPLMAYLYTQGRSINISRKVGGRAIFYTEADAKLNDLIEKYRNRQVCVEPTNFYYALKELKNLIYQ
ncbi:MAG: DUF5659 domain-containing protein [Candidatus Magasanikbacteria bacterium]|jgi:hypothetical protein